jgi:cullin-4
VLKKRPVGKEVNDDDVFYFNVEFTDPRAKVHINSIQVKETVSLSLSPLENNAFIIPC